MLVNEKQRIAKIITMSIGVITAKNLQMINDLRSMIVNNSRTYIIKRRYCPLIEAWIGLLVDFCAIKPDLPPKLHFSLHFFSVYSHERDVVVLPLQRVLDFTACHRRRPTDIRYIDFNTFLQQQVFIFLCTDSIWNGIKLDNLWI